MSSVPPPVVHTPRPRRIRRLAAGIAAVGLVLGAAACGTTGPSTADPTGTSAATTPVSAEPLHLSAGWAKAGSGMTAVFGTVHNGTDAPLTITGGTSPAATSVEVHTMAHQPDGTMKMVRMKDGLTVPAHGSAVLEPGADHLMLLGLTATLENGDDVTVTVRTADGTTVEWQVPVRSFSGADEDYAPGDH